MTTDSSRRFADQFAAIFGREAPVETRVVSFPAVTSNVAWSDDWAFQQEGYSAFAVTDTAYLRSDHYHEVTDVPDVLDYGTFAGVVRSFALSLSEIAGKSERDSKPQ